MLLAMTKPLAFFHGPLPIRSLALTPPAPCVDRYARQVLPPAPTACASAWQCASAPARPPRSPPLPGPLLVTKNVITDLAPPISRDCATDAGSFAWGGSC